MGYESRRGIKITNEYFSGHPGKIRPSLIRSVSGVARKDRAWKMLYIGVASGKCHFAAIVRRIDKYKIDAGIEKIYFLYQSRSVTNARTVEKQLVNYFRLKMPSAMLNKRGGGGGRIGEGPLFFVYVAVA